MKLRGKTKSERAAEIEARKVEREKRRKKAQARQRWQDQRFKWRVEGRRTFGGEEGRQRAATGIRAMLAKADVTGWQASGKNTGPVRSPERSAEG
jgi:hypothetical protein